MRCAACDALLNDFDTSVKTESGKYLDFCGRCRASISEIIELEDDGIILDDSDNEDDEDYYVDE